LPEAAAKSLKDGKITEGHARAILALRGNNPKQGELLHCILNNGWNVRQAEQFVTEVKKGSSKSNSETMSGTTEPILKQINQKLGVAVRIQPKGKGGHLIIPFADEKQFKKIAQKLQN
jgi:ParB family chromosome partitioning protein